MSIPRNIRSDGWTADRQLRFLDALMFTRNVAKAAAAAGMSRNSAYRLRGRRDGTLFAALWDRALEFRPPAQGYTRPLTDGRIMRVLGADSRRKRADFATIGTHRMESRQADRTRTL